MRARACVIDSSLVGLSSLSSLSSLPRTLRVLDLRFARMGHNTMTTLLRGLPDLVELNLADVVEMTPNGHPSRLRFWDFASEVLCMRHLVTLDLTGCHIAHGEVEQLLCMPLSKLCLRHCEFELQYVVPSRSCHLEHLSVSAVAFYRTESAGVALAALSRVIDALPKLAIFELGVLDALGNGLVDTMRLHPRVTFVVDLSPAQRHEALGLRNVRGPR